jgi:hypothetical protein
MQPDYLSVTISPPDPPHIQAGGLRLRRDGTPGSLRVKAPWYTDADVPDWARAIAAEAIRKHVPDPSGPHMHQGRAFRDDPGRDASPGGK